MLGKESQCTIRFFDDINCNCWEARTKKEVCRHITFIFTNLVQNKNLLDVLKKKSIPESFVSEVDDLLFKRLQAKGPGEKEMRILTHSNECALCLTQMNSDEEKLTECKNCKRNFHATCVNRLNQLKGTSCLRCHSEDGITNLEVKLEYLGLQ